MLGKLAGLAQSAKDMAVDAVSSVDLTSVKGAISTTVGAVKDRAGEVVEEVGDRLTHPADAYDQALGDVARRIEIDPEVVSSLRRNNPYR